MLRAGDPRLRAAKFKVLALGYFRDVELVLRRGRQRGRVVLQVRVVERGTIVLNRIFLGSTGATPWWAGFDLAEGSVLGSGVGLGLAWVYAAESDVAGARAQGAGELRFDVAALTGGRIGVRGSVLHVVASEPYRTGGPVTDGDPSHFAAFSYSRSGGRLGLGMRATSLSRLYLDARVERVEAELPGAPTRRLPEGGSAPVVLSLKPGTSYVSTLSLTYERDTRSDPVLPAQGTRLALAGEFGSTWLGGSYNYGSARVRHERWWPLGSGGHVLSMHLSGALVLGDAPRFDLLYVGEINRLLTPRALGLVVSTTPSRDLLGTSTAEITHGEVAGVAELQYARQLFRRRRIVYGGDVFVGIGLWGLGSTQRLQVRDRPLLQALPVDLFVDAGLRLDTEIGIFELSIANGLGRVPL